MKHIPDQNNMSTRQYTHIERELSDVLNKIWENKISIDYEDIKKLQEFSIKKHNNE